MRIVSSAMLIISGVYLALGLIYLRFWWAERDRRDYLAFTLCSISVTFFSWGELGMLHSQTPDEFLFYAWWNFLIGVLPTLSIAWFAYVHLHGRRWLLWTYCGFRLLGAVLHLIMPNGINFREITSVGHITVLGEALSYPIAVPNPWMMLPHLSHVLLIIFCVDASIRAWRRGERRKAWFFGSGVILYRTIVSIGTVSILWGLVQLPFLVSFPIIFVIAAMLYELNFEMHSAAMLTEKLEERDARLTETLNQLQLSAAAANVGLWTRKIGEEKIWLSEKAVDVWGFPGGVQVKREDIFQHIHPADRELYISNIRELEEWKNEYQIEYRFLSKDGNIRWIHSRGKVESLDGARIIRGAIVDITKLKIAEQAVFELSYKLINAQEKERARLARELHDDLSQSIALLSIELSQLRDFPGDRKDMRNQIDHLVSEISLIGDHVHQISHELHPAILIQLGLEPALRGFCREIAAAHTLKVDFEAEQLPVKLPDDISLCLYRVAQEALQNVVKHSGATSAQVIIKFEQIEIHLTVSDNGNGFDLKAKKEGLGLSSIDERARAVRGKAKIISAVGAGTKIEVHIPLGQAS
ncbi:MAG TPA: PAS domain-containing protein [Pyrinomonadaceae bacterium]|jgi:signal transduction histidine kinase